MKATVYFIELTEPQRKELNTEGWNSKIGRAYLTAKDGKIDATNFDLLVKAAVIPDGLFGTDEQIWAGLQNTGKVGWSNDHDIKCHTTFPRSMDIGDIIVWDDGTRQRCESSGFVTL